MDSGQRIEVARKKNESCMGSVPIQRGALDVHACKRGKKCLTKRAGVPAGMVGQKKTPMNNLFLALLRGVAGRDVINKFCLSLVQDDCVVVKGKVCWLQRQGVDTPSTKVHSTCKRCASSTFSRDFRSSENCKKGPQQQ